MSTVAEPRNDADALVADLARAGRKAQRVLARTSDAAKAAALRSAAAALRRHGEAILAGNAKDIAAGEARGL
ncbi:MAG: glutamate-5-semialdehyde dehydrogenase, partial [Croceibacterium sp.]